MTSTRSGPTSTEQLAEAVLRSNDRGTFTVPSGGLYPFRWLWDSALIALGWHRLNPARGWVELEASVAGQWPSGMVPHVLFGQEKGAYFPGPDYWDTGDLRSSGITQPPLTATIARIMLERQGDEIALEACRRLYPRLVAFHRWLYDVRDPHRTGRLQCVHPWETGMDNSPAWFDALERVDASDVPPFRRVDVEIVDPAERPDENFYDRCIAILIALRSRGYDNAAAVTGSPFAVVDVCFNALAVRASIDLVALAALLGEPDDEPREWVRRGTDGLRSLWSERRGHFLSFDERAGASIDIPTSAGFLPLWTGAVSDDQAARLASTARRWRAQGAYGLPSIEPGTPLFEPERYWSGPVWTNVNWMCADGFARYGHTDIAEELRQDALRLVERFGMWEYYDPIDGKGLGSAGFSWTAALTLDLLRDR